MLRALEYNKTAINGMVNDIALEVGGIGQMYLRSPSVFSFFRPEYSPNGPVADSGLVAPEVSRAFPVSRS